MHHDDNNKHMYTMFQPYMYMHGIHQLYACSEINRNNMLIPLKRNMLEEQGNRK